LDRVEVRGEASDAADRVVVAGKVILGRGLLAQSHSSSVRDVLRRDPAISVSATGRIGLLGLPGYTQILLDGELPPAGLDPLDLPPAQIERIEIVRGSSADTGLAAIAGTINVVRRSQRRALPFDGSVELGGPGYQQTSRVSGLSIWKGESAGQTAGVAFNVLRSRSAQRTSQQEWIGEPMAAPAWASTALNRVHHDGLNVSPRVSFKRGEKESINVSADLATSESGTDVDTDWVPGAVSASSRPLHSTYRWRWRTSPSTSLSGEWQRQAEHGGEWVVRTYASWMQEVMETSGSSRWSAGLTDAVTNLDDRRRATNGLRLLRRGWVIDDHKLQWGLEAKQERLTQRRTTDGGASFIDGLFSPNAIGNNRDVSTWLQDEWQWSEALSLKLGLRDERRVHRLDEGPSTAQTRLQMLAPSVNATWTLDDEGDHRLSAGLSRGFNVPLAAMLSPRPILDPTMGCTSRESCGTSRPDAPDRAGNPALQPERSWGLDVNLESNVREHSFLSLGFALRWLDRVVGEATTLQPVLWSTDPRWVARPANLGNARSHALNLSFILAPVDWLPDWPATLEWTGSLKWAGSSVSTVPGPYNRLPDQAPFSATFGLKGASRDWPLEWRVDGVLHPASRWQGPGGELRWQSVRQVWSVSGTWSFDPKHQLTLQASNLPGERQTTESRWADAGYRSLQVSRARPKLSLSWVSQL
jgi:outer membrane receptor protein involved in Fe transport